MARSWRSVLVVLFGAAVLGGAEIGPPAVAQDSATPLSREAVEAIVREYLLKNPELIMESVRAYQQRQQAQERERVAGVLAARRAELFQDPDAPVAGHPAGDVTVVEFFDYRCGYCKSVAPAVRQLQAPGREGKPRGVILIQGDTLRIDHLDAYGYERPTAPFLKRLASEGVLFKNALAQTAWTKASTTSVMTSLYPTTHGVHQIPDRSIPGACPRHRSLRKRRPALRLDESAAALQCRLELRALQRLGEASPPLHRCGCGAARHAEGGKIGTKEAQRLRQHGAEMPGRSSSVSTSRKCRGRR